MDSDEIGSSSLVIDSKHGSESEQTGDQDNISKHVDDEGDGNQKQVKGITNAPDSAKLENSPSKRVTSGKIAKKSKNDDIDDLIVCCTACSSQINPKLPGTVHVHPALGVLLCKKCLIFYNSGTFSKDENGIDEYCRWCAEGGKLLCCDFCTNAFCEGCIRRNLGRGTLAKIVKFDKWHCFMCDQSMLEDLKELCQQVKKRNEDHTKQDHHKVQEFFATPTTEMSMRDGIAICLNNSVQAIRILRGATKMLRKQISGSHVPVATVSKVGVKLKSAIRATTQNLELIGKAVDRELKKSDDELQKEKAVGVSEEPHEDKDAGNLVVRLTLAVDNGEVDKSDRAHETNQISNERDGDADDDGMACFTDSDVESSVVDGSKSDVIAENVSNAISVVVADTSEEDSPAILNEACDPLLSSTPYGKGPRDEMKQSDELVATDVPDSENPELGSLVDKPSDVTTDLNDIGHPLHPDTLDSLQPLCDAIVPQLSEMESPPLTFYPSSEEPKDSLEKGPSNSQENCKEPVPCKVSKSPKTKLPKKSVSHHHSNLEKESELEKDLDTSKVAKQKLPQVHGSDEKKDRGKKSLKHGHKKSNTRGSQDSEEVECEPKAAVVDEINVNFKPSKITPVITEIIETHELLSRLSSAMPENMMIMPTMGEDELGHENDDREAEVVLPDEQENPAKLPLQVHKGNPLIQNQEDNTSRALSPDRPKTSTDAEPTGVLPLDGRSERPLESGTNAGKQEEPDEKEAVAFDTLANKTEGLVVSNDTEKGEQTSKTSVADRHQENEKDEEPIKKRSKFELTVGQEDIDGDDDLDENIEEETTIKVAEDDESVDEGCGDLVIAETPEVPSSVMDVPSEDDEAQSTTDKSPLAKVEFEADANTLAKQKLAESLLMDSSSDDENVGREKVKVLLKKKTPKQSTSSESDVQILPYSPKRDSTTATRKDKHLEAKRHKRNQRKSVILSGSSSSDDMHGPLQADRDSKESKAMSSLSEFSDLKTDRKLNSRAVVVVKRLSASLLKQIRVYGMVKLLSKRRREANETEVLDRDIARLCNFSNLKMKKTKQNIITSDDDDVIEDDVQEPIPEDKDKKTKDQVKSKVKAKKMQAKNTLFSSSEEVESDALDDDIQVAVDKPKALKSRDVDEAKTMNDRAKEMLANMLKESDEASESDSSDSDTDVEENSKVKSKKAIKEKKINESETDDDVKANSNDDDSDFVPAFKKGKKRFSSSLLRARLSEDDSDVSGIQKSSDSRKGRKTRKRQLTSSDDAFIVSSDSSSSFVSRRTRRRNTRRNARSDDDSDSRSGVRKKKRRRIVAVSPDSSDSDDEDAVTKVGTPTGKGGRKNIRKLIKDTKLREDTKFAAREEEERRKRVASLQKLYNEVVEESAAGKGGPVTTKLVLAKDPTTDKTLVEVHPDLIFKLKPHQVEGIKFLWESVCETLERLQTDPGSGCILAHCMGLGKTLQIISFLHALLASKKTYVKNVLVVCPLNTVVNWHSEFQMWLDGITPSVFVWELSSVKRNYERARAMKNWFRDGGVLILGYNMFRTLVQESGNKIPRSCKETFQKTLINPGPDIVVCDEGHILKNSSTAISKAMNRIRTLRRIVLTGTPLQNNLSEYHCMVDFVKKNLLGTMKEFQNRFVHPIQNGQCADSTAFDVRLMKRRAHILHNVLDGCVQRRDYNVLTPFLPPKHEYVISVKLTDLQVSLYQHFLDNMARKSGKNSLFPDYQNLMRIWTHPWMIRLAEIRQEEKAANESDGSFINDDTTESQQSDNDSDNVICLDDEPTTSRGRKYVSSEDEVVNNWKSSSRGGKPRAAELESEIVVPPPCTNWWTEFISEEDVKKIEHSGKILILFDILRECSTIGDKVLLFSQSLLSLNLIEDMLRQSTELADKNETDDNISCGRWICGIDYFRLDGMSSADQRHKSTTVFNDPDNYQARLFLISTRAGSLGINLVAANRVIVFDASWNPTYDIQSIFRVYRFGQDKPVYVYRLLAQGTMEEKIYDRQVTKQSLACRVVDEQQIERHFNFADLQELYTLNTSNVSRRPTPMLPKDRLLAELLRKRKDLIVTYHEHDSLLINREEEELTEEERKAAWVEYEAERQGMLNEIAGGMPGVALNFKVDMNAIILEIQRKNPGISVDDLKAKLHDTVAMLHSARQQALEKERQELIRLQQQQNQQQRDMLMQMLQNPQQAPFHLSAMHNLQNVMQRPGIEAQPKSILPTMSNANILASLSRNTYTRIASPSSVSNVVVHKSDTRSPNE